MMRYAAFFLWLLAAPAYAATVQESLQEAHRLAGTSQYDDALAVLHEAELEHPGNAEITLAMARIQSWQGNYEAAQALIDTLLPEHAENADVQLLMANLAYYRRDYDTADALFDDILQHHPDYTDAQAGLARVAKARAAPAPVTTHRWQLDTGMERSSFSRVKQPGWNQSFLQITHFLEKATAIHGKVTRHDQFTNIDTEYEAGISHRFTDYLNGYVHGALTPHADFRPRRRAAAGGMVRVLQREDGFLPLWVTLDTRYDVYTDVSVLNMNPGLRIEPHDGWAVSARKISVDADNAKRVYGEQYRLDGSLTDSLRFYAGFADAPETVASITVNTKTWFGGVAYAISDDVTLRAGYTRDDRQRSYIREVVNASISYRF